MKKCTKCNVKKKLTDFVKCVKNKSGLSARCKECSSAYYQYRKEEIYKKGKEYYATNRTRVNAYKNEWEKTTGKQTKRASEQKRRDNLSDDYIKRRLRRRGFTNGMIDEMPELIESLREIIKIKRYVKEKTGKKHSGA